MTDFVDRLLGAPDAAAVHPRAPLPFEEGPVLAAAQSPTRAPAAEAGREETEVESREDLPDPRLPAGAPHGRGKDVEVRVGVQAQAASGSPGIVRGTDLEDHDKAPSVAARTGARDPARPRVQPPASPANRPAAPDGGRRAPARVRPLPRRHGLADGRSQPQVPADPEPAGTPDAAGDAALTHWAGAPTHRVAAPTMGGDRWPFPQTARGAARRRDSLPPSEPVVHITIGRLEVRAAPPAQPEPARERTRPRSAPAVPLEEYLRQRSGRPR